MLSEVTSLKIIQYKNTSTDTGYQLYYTYYTKNRLLLFPPLRYFSSLTPLKFCKYLQDLSSSLEQIRHSFQILILFTIISSFYTLNIDMISQCVIFREQPAIVALKLRYLQFLKQISRYLLYQQLQLVPLQNFCVLDRLLKAQNSKNQSQNHLLLALP